MRILLTADPEIPVPPVLYGGIERIIDFLTRELRDRGHTVGLVAHEESTVPTDYFLGWPAMRSQAKIDAMRNTMALRRAVREFKPELLHSFSRVFYLTPHFFSRLPKVMSYQRNPSPRTSRWASRVCPNTLHFTGCSDYICNLGRRGGGEWTTIHNGVELQTYDFQPHVEPDAPLVFLSRLDRIKGAHVAIEAARRAGRKLLIAGNHATSGPEYDYFRRELEPQFGKDGIEYVGPVNDSEKNALLGRAAAMLVPIQWDEPFGIVFAESLACGTPVISSPRGALPEIVREGVDGFLVRSVEEAVAAIHKLDTIDRTACRARAEQKFSSGAITSRYEDLYRRMVARSVARVS